MLLRAVEEVMVLPEANVDPDGGDDPDAGDGAAIGIGCLYVIGGVGMFVLSYIFLFDSDDVPVIVGVVTGLGGIAGFWSAYSLIAGIKRR
jgi:hypothetical protein